MTLFLRQMVALFKIVEQQNTKSKLFIRYLLRRNYYTILRPIFIVNMILYFLSININGYISTFPTSSTANAQTQNNQNNFETVHYIHYFLIKLLLEYEISTLSLLPGDNVVFPFCSSLFALNTKPSKFPPGPVTEPYKFSNVFGRPFESNP